ncbi:MAG: MBL fold metallo-hydrolase [Promethearchaeota archaeon]
MDTRKKLVLVIVISVVVVGSFVLIPSFFGGYDDSDYTTIINPEPIDFVKISVLVEDTANGTLSTAAGLSIFVETENLAILFDAGPSDSVLRDNSVSLGIDLEASCDFVVLSHEHGDHAVGLSYISDIHDNLTLYTRDVVPPSSGTFTQQSWWNDFTKIRVGDTFELATGIALIPMGFEHALVLYVKNLGLVVLVGCSHPGVDNLVARAIDTFGVDDVYMVMGGFHIGEGFASQDQRSAAIDALIDIDVQYICALHCAGDATRNYVQSNYPDHYVEARVGYQIVLNETAIGP